MINGYVCRWDNTNIFHNEITSAILDSSLLSKGFFEYQYSLIQITTHTILESNGAPYMIPSGQPDCMNIWFIHLHNF